jgi:hypothetical protein
VSLVEAFARAEEIAQTVLYEGYMLYPYRLSSTKNRQRWNFGTLYPERHEAVLQGAESCRHRAQCLLIAAAPENAELQVCVRFLHMRARRLRALDSSGESGFRAVESMVMGSEIYENWEEGIERSFQTSLTLRDLIEQPRTVEFSFPATSESSEFKTASGEVVGALEHTQAAVECRIKIAAESVQGGVYRVSAEVTNISCPEVPLAELDEKTALLLRSMVSAHTLLGVSGGEFASLLDPPPHLSDASASCHNEGVYPVLVGEPGERDLMLASPIILYDYPQVAPESAGNFFDGTEMDEMLTLRVMTLTDDEKRQMHNADDRVRQLLERTEASAREQLARTHGAVRGWRPLQDGQA